MNEYIERKAVVEKLNAIGGCDASDDFGKGWDKAVDTAIEAVEKLPAANAAPVKHGYWKSVNGIARCSNCEYVPSYERAIDDFFYSDYCPNCGAKMDD